MNKFKIFFIIISFSVLFGLAEKSWALPAFPGAEGQGASTIGGRGGTVYVVDTLSDNPADGLTFREAVTASGPRIVTFAVSGYINLQSELVVSNPYLTVAGQSSPGGIAITGWSTRLYRTHDVIMTHMRFRPGSHGQGVIDPDAVHALMLEGTSSESDPVYNIIFDHCSFSYGIDETVDIAYNAHDITFSWCTFGPGLNGGHSEGAHSAGLLFWGKYATVNQIISVHHSFFPNNHFRDPEIGSGVTADLKNNVSYNWANALSSQFNSISGQPRSYVNFVQNYAKPGPDSNSCALGYSSEMFFCDTTDPMSKCHAQETSAYPAIYYKGNLGCARSSQSDPEWKIVTGWSPFSLLSTSWQSLDPFPTNDIPVTITTMSEDYAKKIVSETGATRPVRDSEDQGVAADFLGGTELHQPINVSYPADFPVLNSPSSPVDSDNDGMADSWEQSKFGNLDRNGAGDSDNDGYTDLEEYLHELGGYAAASQGDVTAPAAPSGLSVQ